MLGNGFLGKLLHLEIDGGIDAEAVAVKVIPAAVVLAGLVDPAIEGIVGPEERICTEILPGVVRGTPGLLGIHGTAEHVPEIGSHARGAVHRPLVGLDGDGLDGIPLGLGQVPRLLHLGEDEITPHQGLVGVDVWVVPGGLVDHSHQHGALLHLQVYGFLVEELGRGRLNSVGVAAEEHGVEIHVHYLLLGIVPLKLDGGDPFLELYPYHPHLGYPGDLAADIAPGIQGLGQLLGDGAAAALARIPHEERLEKHPSQTLEIDARMPVEAHVLGCHGGLHKVFRELVIADEGPVLDMVCGKDLSVLGNHLGGQLALRILQFLDCGDVGKEPDSHQHQQEQGDRSQQDAPEPLQYAVYGFVRHTSNSIKNTNLYQKFGKLPGL